MGEVTKTGSKSLVEFLAKDYPFRVYQEQIAKLLHVAASDLIGRDYLLQKPDLTLGAALDNVLSDNRDTILRQNLMGLLEKLSVRRTIQSNLIKRGVISHLLTMLNDRADSLCDETAEYAVSILINLCLRTAGKKACAAECDKTLNVLSGLLDHQDPHVQTYVHGILYTLMGHAELRDNANALGFADLLQMHKDSIEPSLIQQVDYILDKLNSGLSCRYSLYNLYSFLLTVEDQPPFNDAVSEDGEDVDDVDEDVSNRQMM